MAGEDMTMRYRDPWLIPKIFLGFLAFLVGIVLLPVVIVCSVVFIIGRRLLSRWQWAVIFVASLIGIIATLGDTWGSYMLWFLSLIGLGGFTESIFNVTLTTPLWVPPLSTFVLGVSLASIVGMILGDDGAISTMSPVKSVKKRPEIVPKDEDRERIRNKLIKLPPPSEYIPAQGKQPKKKQDPKDRKIPLGRNNKKQLTWLSEGELKTHAVVLGSTGSGKTETIKWVAGAMLDMGYNGVIIDLKEDLEPGGLRDFCRAYAYIHDIPYQEVAISDTDGRWYLNALGGMSADQAFDAVVGQSDFDDQYHQSMNRKAAGQVIKLLFHVHGLWPDRYPQPTLFTIGDTMQKDMYKATKTMLAEVTAEIGKEKAEGLYSALFKQDKKLLEEAQSFGLRLTNLYDSDAGRTVLMPGQNSDGEDRVALDFMKPGLIYIGASSLGAPELARTVSSSVLTRLNVHAANVAAGKLSKDSMGKRFVIVDEANFIERRLVHNALSRARSAGQNYILCTQGPTDWIDEEGDDWSKVTQNVNVCIAGKMNSPGAAELTAEFIGEEKTTEATRQIRDGIVEESGQLKSSMEYVVPPDKLRKFCEGEMVLRTPKQTEWVQVPMRNWDLKKYAEAGSPPPSPEKLEALTS